MATGDHDFPFVAFSDAQNEQANPADPSPGGSSLCYKVQVCAYLQKENRKDRKKKIPNDTKMKMGGGVLKVSRSLPAQKLSARTLIVNGPFEGRKYVMEYIQLTRLRLMETLHRSF